MNSRTRATLPPLHVVGPTIDRNPMRQLERVPRNAAHLDLLALATQARRWPKRRPADRAVFRAVVSPLIRSSNSR